MGVSPNPVVHEIKISVAADSPQTVTIQQEKSEEKISKTMQIPNHEGSLSNLSFLIGDEIFVKIFSALTVADVTNLWNDICVITKKYTNIKTMNLFINSPGGDAFSGLALADHLIRAQKAGIRVIAHASGIIASAAVPVFAVCDERLAAPGTIFMVHETSIWKWPGRETASDIRSQ
ncbi:MAG TPA: ATP-dependent Clp protease proteolytic subunit, partial [Methanosarcinales archaeon]|nr:ATP-dependent Clp protease proteolytic subunit [Methanosarcinales archaeon]